MPSDDSTSPTPRSPEMCEHGFPIPPRPLARGRGVSNPSILFCCTVCGKPGYQKASQLAKIKRPTCSHACKVRDQSNNPDAVCEVCKGKLGRNAKRFCSNACKGIAYSETITLSCKMCSDPFDTEPSRIAHGYGLFCSVSCSNRWRVTPEDVRYGRSLGPQRDDGCRYTDLPPDSDGYGSFTLAGGKQVGAHRYALARAMGITLGELNGLSVLHTCDVRPCVQDTPISKYVVGDETFTAYGHLFAADHIVNMKDKSAKGRVIRGEQSKRASLTEAKVREIRQYAASGMSYPDINRLFPEVGLTAIHKVAQRQTWKHVE